MIYVNGPAFVKSSTHYTWKVTKGTWNVRPLFRAGTIHVLAEQLRKMKMNITALKRPDIND